MSRVIWFRNVWAIVRKVHLENEIPFQPVSKFLTRFQIESMYFFYSKCILVFGLSGRQAHAVGHDKSSLPVNSITLAPDLQIWSGFIFILFIIGATYSLDQQPLLELHSFFTWIEQ